MENSFDFRVYVPTDENTGPDGPLTPVQAFRTCLHDYVYGDHFDIEIGWEITSKIQVALEKFVSAFTEEQDDELFYHLSDMQEKFDAAAIAGVRLVIREIEQDFSDFFEELISGSTEKTV